MNKQHLKALRKHGATDEDSVFDWLDGAAPPPKISFTPLMMCGLSETHSQITFRTTKPSSEVFSVCATPCKTITGIQQLQIALKFPILSLWIINESQTKKDKKKKGGREISTACPSSGECYKAVIMPENEKWNKVVGARKGEAETETKSWKFRAPRVKRKAVLLHMQKRQSCRIDTQLKQGWTTAFASVSVRSVLCESEEIRNGRRRGQNGKAQKTRKLEFETVSWTKASKSEKWLNNIDNISCMSSNFNGVYTKVYQQHTED